MVHSTVTPADQFEQDREIWQNLQTAIAKSSGFKRWQLQQTNNEISSLEWQVRLYLRETLATLAY
jgi:hypothetical protein